jgi:hypothetical protein
MQVFLWPGYLFQKITTQEPDDSQLEIALTAMRAALPAHESLPQALRGEEPAVLANYGEAVLLLPANVSPADSALAA